jgi:hypothetical protein
MYVADKDEIELLRKQDKFFSDLYNAFDKSEHSKYQYVYNKFWTKLNASVDCQKELDTLQAQTESYRKKMSRMTRWFLIFLASLVAINYFNNRSEIEGGLILFFFIACYGWAILRLDIYETAQITSIENLKRLILLLKSDLFECRNVDLSAAEKYLTIVHHKGLTSKVFTEAEQYTISKVRIDLNISIAESMGYKIPTFYDSFDTSFKQRV